MQSPTPASIPRTGVTDGSNATAGQVGEYLTNTSTNFGIGSANWTSTATLTLTPGDWEVEGFVTYGPSAAALSGVYAGIGTGINSGPPSYTCITGPSNLGQVIIAAPRTRFNVTSSTTIYLQAYVYIGSGTCNVAGVMNARRMR
jgi:hypothetical protein